MIVKLLTEHYLEFLSFKGGRRGSSEATRQNATLLEISRTGSFHIINAVYTYLPLKPAIFILVK